MPLVGAPHDGSSRTSIRTLRILQMKWSKALPRRGVGIGNVCHSRWSRAELN
jgi:hypothetical protein